MKQAMNYIQKDNIIITEDSQKVFEISFDSFQIEDESLYINSYDDSEITKPKKSSPKKTKTKKLSNGAEYIPVEEESSGELSQLQSNEPYSSTYNETRDLLKVAISQIDMLSGELKVDLDAIRASKVLKKKYDYIPEITSTLGTLLSTKLSAIKEINKTITDSHNLDLKRAKELKLNSKDEVNDDKFIMDTYNAFIGMGDQTQGMSIPMTEMVHMNGPINMVRNGIGGEGIYEEYTNNINPIQNRMRYEQDPNVKTVVVYDQMTGAKYFDIMNVQTGESINNIQRPDPMFLEDVTIDTTTCIARNTNLDQTYPVILINNGSAIKY